MYSFVYLLHTIMILPTVAFIPIILWHMHG